MRHNELMISTLIPTTELLTILEKNRVEHVQLFQTTYANYVTAVTIALQERLKLVTSGADFDLVFGNVGFPPVSHADDYDLAIKMIELHSNAEIELTLSDAKCLIMNDWNWSIQFDESVLHYSRASRSTGAAPVGGAVASPRL